VTWLTWIAAGWIGASLVWVVWTFVREELAHPRRREDEMWDEVPVWPDGHELHGGTQKARNGDHPVVPR
jgi:hypothetical protein